MIIEYAERAYYQAEILLENERTIIPLVTNTETDVKKLLLERYGLTTRIYDITLIKYL